MRQYRIGRLNGRFVVTWVEDGRRRRYRLDALTIKEAEAEALDVIRQETAPVSGNTVATIWGAYLMEREGRPIATTMGYTGKAVLEHFGALRHDQITTQHCRDYTAKRIASGISQGTVWTELGHLRSAMIWAERVRMIDRAPMIERPQKPAPKERFLTRAEIDRLLAAEMAPHIRLAIILMLTTAGRIGAILDLVWTRVDFERGQVNLRADAIGPRKGRAVVPMNATLRAALLDARQAAMTEFVVEWAGKRVGSIRTGFNAAVEAAGLDDVTPHVLRHTAAVHMVAAGVPISKASQYLGHSNTAVTERVYARYAPDHLRDASDVLEFGGVREVK